MGLATAAMDSSQAADLVIVLLCSAMLLAYNAYYIYGARISIFGLRSIWSITVQRGCWAEAMMAGKAPPNPAAAGRFPAASVHQTAL